jgi:hypothetical protein
MESNSLGQSPSRRRPKRRGHYQLPGMREKLRITSNIGLIVGQCILLFVDRDWGLRFIICSSMLSFPYFWHHKMWDVVALMVFLNVVNVFGLFFK